MSASVVAALLVGAGSALLAMGILGRVRARDDELASYLELPYGEHDVSVAAATEHGLFEGALGAAGRMLDPLDAKGQLRAKLERARVPMRPGEVVALTAAAGVGVGAFVAMVTTQLLLGVATVAAAPFVTAAVLNHLADRRRKRFEAQLPEALSVIASSLSAGHTFLRSIQMMCEEAEPPLSEEFARVVHETRLGDPVVDALERMALRLDVRDLVWVVQAIRIQQTVGGKLADLLHTLTDFMRAREEIRREVNVLTAEGRMSAWVLGALPVFLLLAIQVISPGYMEPLFRGAGLIVLALTAASVAAGVAMIRRMARIEV